MAALSVPMQKGDGMNWKFLLEAEEENFYRSIVFRFPAKHPFESVVDFMVIEDVEAPLRLKLICSTGYHAGQTELVFPEEASHAKGGISVGWLKENWEKCVYSSCKVSEVSYVSNYPPEVGANT